MAPISSPNQDVTFSTPVNPKAELDSLCDVSWVLPNLAVSGCLPLNSPEKFLEKLNVSGVVDMRSEDRDESPVLEKMGIKWLHLPTEDREGVSQEMLNIGVEW